MKFVICILAFDLTKNIAYHISVIIELISQIALKVYKNSHFILDFRTRKA